MHIQITLTKLSFFKVAVLIMTITWLLESPISSGPKLLPTRGLSVKILWTSGSLIKALVKDCIDLRIAGTANAAMLRLTRSMSEFITKYTSCAWVFSCTREKDLFCHLVEDPRNSEALKVFFPPKRCAGLLRLQLAERFDMVLGSVDSGAITSSEVPHVMEKH